MRHTISADIALLKVSSLQVNRPAVFFLPDGQPTEKEATWKERLAEMKDPAFNERPNILASASVILRLFAGSRDSCLLTPYVRHLSAHARDLLSRSLCPDAANRPLAGEWQLARRHLLAAGGLNERYPGPRRHRS